MLRKITKLEDGDYEYRGVEFARVDRLRGYAGHYQVHGRVNGDYVSSSHRRTLLDKIDQALDNPHPDPFDRD